MVRYVSQFVRQRTSQPAFAKCSEKRIAENQNISSEARNEGEGHGNGGVEISRIEIDAVNPWSSRGRSRLLHQVKKVWPVLAAQFGKARPRPLRQDGDILFCGVEQIEYKKHDQPDALARINNADRHKQRNNGKEKNPHDNAFEKKQSKT